VAVWAKNLQVIRRMIEWITINMVDLKRWFVGDGVNLTPTAFLALAVSSVEQPVSNNISATINVAPFSLSAEPSLYLRFSLIS
jgi:hypothetical protein